MQASVASVEAVNAVMAVLNGHIASRLDLSRSERQLAAKVSASCVVAAGSRRGLADVRRLALPVRVCFVRTQEALLEGLRSDMATKAAELARMKEQDDLEGAVRKSRNHDPHQAPREDD